MYTAYTFFLMAFTAIFVIVNPIGNVMVFLSLTEDRDSEEKKRLARRSSMFGCLILLVFAISGSLILSFFQITVNSLRVIGGILLLTIAMSMMHGETSKAGHTTEEAKEASQKEDISFFPMAIPMLSGPASITTAILIMGDAGNSMTFRGLAIIAIILPFIICLILFSSSEEIHRVIGVTGGMVVTRMMGLILGALSVQFITTGLWQIYLGLQHSGVG
ncbi:MAG: MarC family protein [Euryarchaeota archaeon]|nr:MarC family protein [Euryarchaeota archaeon]